jgi:hypothetical protein
MKKLKKPIIQQFSILMVVLAAIRESRRSSGNSFSRGQFLDYD